MVSEMMNTKLALSRPLKTLVTKKFQQARQGKDVVFSETQLVILENHEIGAFQLRYLPTLADKPTDLKSKSDQPIQGSVQTTSGNSKPKAKFDPFDSPSDELLVAQVPATKPSHNLVLNKFPVIPNHFILATQENKPQDHPLEANDLSLSYECVKAWRDIDLTTSAEQTQPSTSSDLFAFFNSGNNSGASQPHRHVQFLPIEDVKADCRGDSTWSLLVNSMTTKHRPHLDLLVNPSLSIVHYAIEIKPDISETALHDNYMYLLQATWATLAYGTADIDLSELTRYNIFQAPNKKNNDATESNLHRSPTSSILKDEKVGFDYNLCMTIDKMAIIPRLSSDASVPSPSLHDTDSHVISVNGTVLAGTLMTKSEKLWAQLKQHPTILQEVLRQIGYPKSTQASL